MIIPCRFSARKLESVPSAPGCWNTTRMGVFDGDTQIGEFTYGYSTSAPFYPFEQNGEWYALMSTDYVAISIMKLPSCEILGGEPKESYGFCPVELWVPAFYRCSFMSDFEAGKRLDAPKECWFRMYDFEIDDPKEIKPGTIWHYDKFALVAGCVWGDDTSWKVEMRDLSRVSEGIISKVDIGYIPLAHSTTLHKGVRVLESDDEIYGLEIDTSCHVRLKPTIHHIQMVYPPVNDKEPEVESCPANSNPWQNTIKKLKDAWTRFGH